MTWILGTLLLGGSVYINGVKANSLRNFEIEDVDVKIDANGDIYITAPNLIVEVAGAEQPPTPPPAPETTPAPEPTVAPPAAPAPSPLGQAPPAQPAVDAPPQAAPVGQPAVVAPTPVLQAPEMGVPPEAWWLVIEDNGSSGHVLEIAINGVPVTNYSSGSAPVMIDLATFLHPGENQVDVVAVQSPALGGGVLHVYLAPGANQDGELVLEEPALVFSRRASDDPEGATFHRTLSIP